MILSLLAWVYNEAGVAAGHWIGRNVVNAMGLSTFEVGACLIAGTGPNISFKSLYIYIALRRKSTLIG